MSLFDHIQKQDLHEVRPAHVGAFLRKTGLETPLSPHPPWVRRYRLSLEVNWDYWSDNRGNADEIAKYALIQYMHQDILAHISALRCAIASYDHTMAMETCDRIEHDLGLKGAPWRL